MLVIAGRSQADTTAKSNKVMQRACAKGGDASTQFGYVRGVAGVLSSALLTHSEQLKPYYRLPSGSD